VAEQARKWVVARLQATTTQKVSEKKLPAKRKTRLKDAPLITKDQAITDSGTVKVWW
jgi:hypothetical protein